MDRMFPAIPATQSLIIRVGQNHIYINIYIQFTYGIFGRDITIYAVIYGVYIRFWPTLLVIYVRSTTLYLITYRRLHLSCCLLQTLQIDFH